MSRRISKAFAVDDGIAQMPYPAHFGQSLKVAIKTPQILDGWSNVVPVEKITSDIKIWIHG